MSISSLLAMGTGGALGAIGRWGLSLLPFRGEFPLLTLVTNLLGAVLILSLIHISEPTRP